MRKYVVAIDSMKGCLSSADASSAFASGILRGDSSAEVRVLPVADGGEGTAAVLAGALRTAERIVTRVTGPCGSPVDAEWWFDEKSAMAFIDMAQASGLTLVGEDSRNPLLTTSFGFGQLIEAALSRGVVAIVAGLGGSATVDGGMGACQALGVRFLGPDGGLIPSPASGRMLSAVADIDISELDRRLRNVRLTLVCDVRNPLSGISGAARVFGPQKGASPHDVEVLESGMENLRSAVRRTTSIDLNDVPGSGAAGGCGGALMALAGGEIREGAPYVLDAIGFDTLIADATAVITGEGSADAQTLMGKLPSGILARCLAAGVPASLVAGRIKESAALKAAGFSALVCVNSPEIIAASGTEGGRDTDSRVAGERLAAAGALFGASSRRLN